MKRLPEHTAVKRDGDLYLNTSLLRPGDVLLTRGRVKESHWIARLTWGPFSHAALVVNGSVLFESDDLGVGYTALHVDRVERSAAGKHLLSVLTDVDRAVLLRHPRMAHSMAADVEEDLVEALYPAFGREYPPWANLASALPGGPLIRGVGRLLLRAKAAFDGDDKVWNPGQFCSQLVADALMRVLKEKKLSLFVPPRSPANINPNTLLRSELVPVPQAIGPADLHATVDEELLRRLHAHIVTPSRQDSTGSLVRTKVQATMNIEVADTLIAHQKKRVRALSDALSGL